MKSARSTPSPAGSGRSQARHEAAQAHRRARALEVLLAGGTQASAAKAAGVSLRTLHRWREGDVAGFWTEYQRTRSRALDALGERMHLAANRGLTTLLEAVEGAKTTREQLAAARALVRLAAGVALVRAGGDALAPSHPIAVQPPTTIVWIDNGRGPPPPGAKREDGTIELRSTRGE